MTRKERLIPSKLKKRPFHEVRVVQNEPMAMEKLPNLT